MDKIIDFHTHCYVPALADKAAARLPKESPYYPVYHPTIDGLKNYMLKCGISSAVALNIAGSPKSERAVNDWAIECQTHNNIYAFGSVHPLSPNIKQELKRLKENGIKGIKLHPYYQQFYACSKEAYAVYEAAACENLAMLFHCGYDIMIEGDFCLAKDFYQIYKDFKGCNLIGAHLGGWNDFDNVFKLLIGLDVYLDTSFAFSFLDENYRKLLIKNHPHNRLLFGSDAPWMDAKKEVDLLSSYLDEKSKELIFYKNALNILS